MTSAAIKLELMERLASVKDEAVIKRIATMLRRAFPEVMAGDGDDITDEEYAAFEDMRAKRLRGEVKFLTEKESMAEIQRLIAAECR
ncbi:MAG: hypothetical protein M9900_05095 [Flavobacteriales bacterium]|nr:hypothetical protein [Flavobacteriales bacterium]